jgi:hypothetical protein
MEEEKESGCIEREMCVGMERMESWSTLGEWINR